MENVEIKAGDFIKLSATQAVIVASTEETKQGRKVYYQDMEGNAKWDMAEYFDKMNYPLVTFKPGDSVRVSLPDHAFNTEVVTVFLKLHKETGVPIKIDYGVRDGHGILEANASAVKGVVK